MGKHVKITMKQWNDWHEMGDVVVVDELLKLTGDNIELEELSNDCWKHEFFVEGGEDYEDFKDRFCEITSKYVIDWEN